MFKGFLKIYPACAVFCTGTLQETENSGQSLTLSGALNYDPEPPAVLTVTSSWSNGIEIPDFMNASRICSVTLK